MILVHVSFDLHPWLESVAKVKCISFECVTICVFRTNTCVTV